MTEPESLSAETVSLLRRRLRRGFVRNAVAAVFNGGSTFLVNVAVARLLGKETFGEFTMTQVTILTLTNVASLAVGLTVTKHVAETHSVDPEKTGRILGLFSLVSSIAGGLAAVALALFSGWTAEHLLKAPQLTAGLWFAAIAVFFNVVNGYQTGALAGLESYGAIARAAVVSGTMYLLLCVGGAARWGRDGALAGLALASAVQWGALRWALARELRSRKLAPRYRELGSEVAVLLRFSIPAALSGLFTTPALWVASLFVVREPGGYPQVALYGAATNLRVLALFLPQLLITVSTPILNNLRGAGRWLEYRKAFQIAIASTAATVGLAATGIALCGPGLLSLFGRDFRGGYPVLLVLLGAAVLEALTAAVYQVVQAEGRMWSSMALVMLPRDLLIVSLSYAWRSPAGALGLASAYAVGWTVALAMTLLLTKPLLRRAQGGQPLAN